MHSVLYEIIQSLYNYIKLYICRIMKECTQFKPGTKFEHFCRNYAHLYVSYTIRVENKVSDVYFVNNYFSLVFS